MQRFGKVLFAAVIVCGLAASSRAEEGKTVIGTNEIIGQNVVNNSGEKLGSIDDLVVDQEGNLLYAVLGHGGVLGIGESHLATPWSALKISVAMDGDKRTVKLVLPDMTAKEVEKGPQLKKENYAELADADWVARNAKFYKAEAPSKDSSREGYRLVSQMMKADVLDSANEDFAEIEAFVLDPEFHKVTYVVIDHESTLTDSKLVAVPFGSAPFTKIEGGFRVNLNAAKKVVDGAPRVTNGTWIELNDESVREQIKKAFPGK